MVRNSVEMRYWNDSISSIQRETVVKKIYKPLIYCKSLQTSIDCCCFHLLSIDKEVW
uniref:Uncharacterized protein n=1 Tax=Setaria italica TaxID=4555 RepID=K3YXL6_SETIT